MIAWGRRSRGMDGGREGVTDGLALLVQNVILVLRFRRVGGGGERRGGGGREGGGRGRGGIVHAAFSFASPPAGARTHCGNGKGIKVGGRNANRWRRIDRVGPDLRAFHFPFPPPRSCRPCTRLLLFVLLFLVLLLRAAVAGGTVGRRERRSRRVDWMAKSDR